MFARVVRVSRLFVFVSWFSSNWSSVSIPNVAESRPLADQIFLGRSKETLLAGLRNGPLVTISLEFRPS